VGYIRNRMVAPQPGPARGIVTDVGRGLRWRLGVGVLGLALAAGGGALILWPHLLAWAVGGSLGLVGLVLAVSAIAARGARKGH